MITIKMDNTHSEIKCSEEMLKEIRMECLSYMQEGAEHIARHNPFWDGRIYLCTKKGIFPSGLIPKLLKFLESKKIEHRVEDVRTVPKKEVELTLTLAEGMAPRYYQSDCVEIAKERHRGVFVMGTGAGKTLTSALVIASKGVQTLIVVPDTGLRDQMSADYEKWFGAKNVGTDIAGKEPIIVANIQSLNKASHNFTRFKMLVIDEFHHAAAKTYKDVNTNCSNAYYRYGFTGTFMRSDGSDMEMHGVLSNVIFKKTTSELIEEGFLVRPYISVMRLDISETGAHGRPRRLRLNYRQAYEYIINHKPFNEAIAKIAATKIKEGKQTLIVVRRKEHGKLLNKMIKGSFYLNGDDSLDHRRKVKKAFIDKKIRCLVATNIFGEGQDIPTIDVFINARAEKTEIQTAQGIGRALRKHGDKDKAEVFDFLIIGQKHLEDHSVERINSYRRQPAFKIQIRRV